MSRGLYLCRSKPSKKVMWRCFTPLSLLQEIRCVCPKRMHRLILGLSTLTTLYKKSSICVILIYPKFHSHA